MPTLRGPVLVVGATGFLGRHVVRQLRALGLEVTVAVRDPAKAGFGPRVEVVAWDGRAPFRWDGAPRTVISLAGAPIAGTRWSEEYKLELVASRVSLTNLLVEWMRVRGPPVETFLTASAVGYYGALAEGSLKEDAPAGTDFLARLCAAWEDAAADAEYLDARHVALRFGVLLGREGGMLQRLEPIYRAGGGGPIGNGQQPFAWCHVVDAARAVLAVAADPRIEEAVNVVAPEPATYAAFSRQYARALHRPNLAPVPPRALKAMFGESATVLTGGQRAVPSKLEEAGFLWRYPTLPEALAAVTRDPEGPTPVVDVAAGTLDHVVTVDAPLPEVWAFFSDPRNLGALTPPDMGFEVGQVPERPGKGTLLEHTLRLGPFRTAWASRLTEWDPPTRFQDTQEKGPYPRWVHDHHFEPRDGATRVRDHIRFGLPLGPLGRLMSGASVRRNLASIFAYRHQVLESRFGVVEDPGPPQGGAAPRAAAAQ